MKDKLKAGSEVLKGMIETGGKVAEKVLDKGTDVATDMMNNMSGLISKLSDDIGVMANRILTMEERIGLMADRMVKTEALMAKLTATLANKEFEPSIDTSDEKGALRNIVLNLASTKVTENSGPDMFITGNPTDYLLYVSTNPLFQEGSTVISHINDTEDYNTAWKRSISAIRGLRIKANKNNEDEAVVVSVAVKTVAENNRISTLSNSVDVTVLD